MEVAEHPGDFLLGQHDRDTPWGFGTFKVIHLCKWLFEDLTIEAEQGLQSHILRRGGNLPFHCKV